MAQYYDARLEWIGKIKKCQVSCTWWAYTARYCDARIEWIGKIKKRNVK